MKHIHCLSVIAFCLVALVVSVSSANATQDPTPTPTEIPTSTPTLAPTATPTLAPTATSTVAPTATSTVAPTATPTVVPTATRTPALPSACRKSTNLKVVGLNARGGTLIYKSNWNKSANREMTFGEGNHSQKGAAFLVQYKSLLNPNKRSIQIYNAKCQKVATMGRFPRCNFMGCGVYDRWYMKASGGSFQTVAKLLAQVRKSGGSETVYVELRGGKVAKIKSIYNNREQL